MTAMTVLVIKLVLVATLIASVSTLPTIRFSTRPPTTTTTTWRPDLREPEVIGIVVSVGAVMIIIIASFCARKYCEQHQTEITVLGLNQAQSGPAVSDPSSRGSYRYSGDDPAPRYSLQISRETEPPTYDEIMQNQSRLAEIQEE